MSKKFNKREIKIIKLMAFVVFATILVEGYGRYNEAKMDLQFKIDTEVLNQETLLAKVKESPDVYIRKANALASTLDVADEKILRMNNQSNAQFLFQEDITKAADKAEINLNSLNKRRSKELFKGSDMVQLKTYFGFNCSLVNLLDFLDQVSHNEYFMAVDTLNINVNTKRRKRRKKGVEEADPGITIRGSCVFATLYQTEGSERAQSTPDNPPGESDEAKTAQVELTDKGAASVPDGDKGKKESKKVVTQTKVKNAKQGNLNVEKSGKEEVLVKKPRPLTHTKKMKGGGKF